MFATVEAKLNHANYLLLDSKEQGREEGREELKTDMYKAMDMIEALSPISEIVYESHLTEEEVKNLIVRLKKQDFYNLA